MAASNMVTYDSTTSLEEAKVLRAIIQRLKERNIRRVEFGFECYRCAREDEFNILWAKLMYRDGYATLYGERRTPELEWNGARQQPECLYELDDLILWALFEGDACDGTAFIDVDSGAFIVRGQERITAWREIEWQLRETTTRVCHGLVD